MSTDSTIMLRRNFKHTVRNPVTVFNAVLFPIVLLLMFVYVIGGAFNVGVKYVEYVTPGIIILTICYGLSATAVAVNSDMAKGIINRFKVMDISRSAVLNAQVVATLLRSLVAIAAVIGVAFAMDSGRMRVSPNGSARSASSRGSPSRPAGSPSPWDWRRRPRNRQAWPPCR
jgi:ABC-2 type transport system permease protein